MKLGLLTDIHNDAKQLRRAIELLLQSGVEQFVTIGDSFDPLADPEGISEVAELLMAHPTQGVWGNHDFAFCVAPPAQYTERYTPKLFQVTRLSVRGKGTTKEAKNAKGDAARVRREDAARERRGDAARVRREESRREERRMAVGGVMGSDVVTSPMHLPTAYGLNESIAEVLLCKRSESCCQFR